MCYQYTSEDDTLGQDLRILTTERDLTKIMVEEMEFTVVGDGHPIDQSTKISQASHARRELLLMIIAHEPGTISQELGKRLWNVLVGIESKTATGRGYILAHFEQCLEKILHNVFLGRASGNIFRIFLPMLHRRFLGVCSRGHIFLDGGSPPQLRGGRSQLRMPGTGPAVANILTAPPNNIIDAQAIGVLVEVLCRQWPNYVLPRAKARAIHLALVERCLNQLKVRQSSSSV